MIFRPQLPLIFQATWRQNNAIVHLIGKKTSEYLGRSASGFVIMHVNTNFAIPARVFTWGGGGGGNSAHERGGDARRRFWMKPLKETDLGVARAFFDL